MKTKLQIKIKIKMYEMSNVRKRIFVGFYIKKTYINLVWPII
jgi:hypothetical protein